MRYQIYSKARKTFNDNAADIERLLEIHNDLGGRQRGRRRKLEVFNKSAIVLITSFWEAYCEDRASEALYYIIHKAISADSLPKELRKEVAKELDKDNDETAMWKLAGEGWKGYLKERFDILKEKRNRKLNTPKHSYIDELFLTSIGLKNISKSWTWSRMTATKARSKLDKYVTLRGEIAHRGKSVKSCTKKDVEDYFDHIKKLVINTDMGVSRFIVLQLHVKKKHNKSVQ